MNVRRITKWVGLGFLGVILLLAGVAGSAWWYFHPKVSSEAGIVYGRRNGEDLTMTVVRPKEANGLGVVLLVSGGWKSGTNSFRRWMAAPLL